MATTSRWHSAVTDGVRLLAVIWVIPVAILAIGAPIALAGSLAVWIGRLVRHAF